MENTSSTQIVTLNTNNTVVIERTPSLTDDEISTQLAQQVLYSTAKEAAISLAFTGITCLFVATTGGVVLLLTATIAIILFNAAIRSGAAYSTYQLHLMPAGPLDEQDTIAKESFKTFLKFASYICPLSFSIIDSTTRDLITHEAGHLIAAELLCQNPKAYITVDPFVGGATYFNSSKLSGLGQFFGAKNSDLIISAAGTGLSFAFAIFNLIAAHQLSESRPEASRYLLGMSLSSIANSIFYAASAYLSSFNTMSGHDFVHLAKLGVNPLVAIAAMIAIPLLVKCSLFAIDQLKDLYHQRQEQSQPLTLLPA